ncbi:hypothetical protein FHY55_08065 [Oceanicola sp. D3]|uniref:hypothetical protein n=1 Tax=Oceanicola sp. D3 TaxID=2587163 RepID=UPI001120D62D|nr:hypothetical protein [Oceanicola sp. D3]QDC09198.1 hypothetical protein FHY55_08065 [Oceanicola sp. D3]
MTKDDHEALKKLQERKAKYRPPFVALSLAVFFLWFIPSCVTAYLQSAVLFSALGAWLIMIVLAEIGLWRVGAELFILLPSEDPSSDFDAGLRRVKLDMVEVVLLLVATAQWGFGSIAVDFFACGALEC